MGESTTHFEKNGRGYWLSKQMITWLTIGVMVIGIGGPVVTIAVTNAVHEEKIIKLENDVKDIMIYRTEHDKEVELAKTTITSGIDEITYNLQNVCDRLNIPYFTKNKISELSNSRFQKQK